MSRSRPNSFNLNPIAVVEMADQRRHFLKVKGATGREEKLAWIPVSKFTSILRLKEFIADLFGYIFPPRSSSDGKPITTPPELATLYKALQQRQLPRVVGTSRLGWTPERDAFIYGERVIRGLLKREREYEFIAPEGTPLQEAADAFRPGGNREEQYRGFRDLWDRSPDFKLALSLAAVSPFLELLGSPTQVLHYAGQSGLGKTTTLRAAISAFANPRSFVTLDFSKDTKNYADAQLGILHNFPVLVDETTLRGSKELAEAAYRIAVGRTKGRLTGPNQHYLPAKSWPYTLVCLLSGEVSIREEMEHRGAAARFVEIKVDTPLLPKAELPRWWAFAQTHYGWFGYDLMERQTNLYLADGGKGLQQVHDVYYEITRRWCPDSDHSRTIGFLAIVQVGYRMAATLLGFDASHQAAKGFAQEVYQRLNKATKPDRVIEAIRGLPGMAQWVARGFIPVNELEPVAEELFGSRKDLRDFLMKTHKIVKKIESRTIQSGSTRCYVLTPKGKELLQ